MRNTVVANVSATAQGGAIGRATTTGASDQFGEGSGLQATRNSVFVSSRGPSAGQPQFGSADWSAWVSAELRSFSGGNDGDSYDVVAGIGNRVSSDLIIGGFLAYGESDLNVGGAVVESRSPAIGVYMARRFGDALRFDLSLSTARPEYEVAGSSFTARRHMLSLGLEGSHAMGAVDVQPFVRLFAFRENQPSYTTTTGVVPRNEITSSNLSLGGRITPLEPYANGILPYLSLAAEFSHRDSTIGGSTTLWSPRLGLGLSMTLDQAYLAIDLDAGEVLDGTRDYGLRLTYQWNF